MCEHISDYIKKPHIVQLKENFYVARFESMKIYSTLYAVGSLLAEGRITKDTTLIDSSSGIYAYALALACHKYKLKCHIIASKTVDNSIKAQLKLLGAVVEGVNSVGTLKLDQELRVKKVKSIISKNNNYYWMQQYHDDIHYQGYREFAEQIAKEVSSDQITLVGGVGSGCSTGASAKYLRDLGKRVTLYGLQPYGSVSFGCEDIDDPEVIIAGIGSAIPFSNINHAAYDYIDWLSFDLCKKGTIKLMEEHAIFAGLSSGGSYYIAEKLHRENPDNVYIFIAPDMGHRYVDDVYMKSGDIVEDQEAPVHIGSSNELFLPWSRVKWSRRGTDFLEEFKIKKVEKV
jgi:cysteine synthase A